MTPERRVHTDMKSRCYNKNHHAYARYGGRGIMVDPTWMKFDAFLADMGPKPTGYTLERKDNNLGYSKGNCQWSTYKAQARNRRDNTVTQAVVDEIRRRYAAGARQADLGRDYDIPKQQVFEIVRGRTWV